MATSLSLPNLFSFFFPPKSPAAPKLAPTQVSTPPPPTQQSQSLNLSLNSRDDLSSVICPSLAYSNTLYAKNNYNVQVVVEEDEPEDLVLSRFRREVISAGIFQEVRRRMFHENKQDEKKRRLKETQRRNRTRRTFSRFRDDEDGGEKKRTFSRFREDEDGGEKKPQDQDEDDEDDDNWDMPEGEEDMMD